MNSGLIGILKSIKMNSNLSAASPDESDFDELPLKLISGVDDFEKSLKSNDEKLNRYVCITYLSLKKM